MRSLCQQRIVILTPLRLDDRSHPDFGPNSSRRGPGVESSLRSVPFKVVRITEVIMEFLGVRLLTLLVLLAPVHRIGAAEGGEYESFGSGPREAETRLAAQDSRLNLPMRIGEVNVVAGNVLHRVGVVLDDQGTVYLLSVLSNGDSNLLRISRTGVAKELIMFRGWPYILDKRGRVWAFNPSWGTDLRNKIPYIALRSVRTLPVAGAIGIASFGVALIDQTLFGILPFQNFTGWSAFFSGVTAFYGIDVAHTIFFMSPRTVGTGGNYFTERIASGVKEVKRDPQFRDFQLVLAKGWPRAKRSVMRLSEVSPEYASRSSCLEYLTRMNMR